MIVPTLCVTLGLALRSREQTVEVAHNLFTLVRGRSRRVLSTKSVVPHRQIGSGSIPPLRVGQTTGSVCANCSLESISISHNLPGALTHAVTIAIEAVGTPPTIANCQPGHRV